MAPWGLQIILNVNWEALCSPGRSKVACYPSKWPPGKTSTAFHCGPESINWKISLIASWFSSHLGPFLLQSCTNPSIWVVTWGNLWHDQIIEIMITLTIFTRFQLWILCEKVVWFLWWEHLPKVDIYLYGISWAASWCCGWCCVWALSIVRRIWPGLTCSFDSIATISHCVYNTHNSNW